MSKGCVKAKFEPSCRVLPISSIILFRVDAVGRNSPKYRQILASIRAVGLVEAPVVYPLHGTETYGLLDGQMRLQALKELKVTEVACIIATEDDSYTYNRQINRLSPIQSNKMIHAAIKQGVPAERLALALDITMGVLTRRKNLLDGICPEVRSMLAAKDIPTAIFELLKRMKPLRQIEACELMQGQANYSPTFARAILAATPNEQLNHPRRSVVAAGTIEQSARLEKELATLQERMRSVEESYGPDVLRFTVIKTYVAAIISRASIAKVMRARFPDILIEFEKITEISNLPDTAAIALPRSHSQYGAQPGQGA